MKDIRILFTHDLHDRIDSFNVYMNKEEKSLGGYKRLKKEIDGLRDESTLVLDGGDFSMGTLYQTIFEKESPSLRLLGDLGYDATTLGNHEFEMGSYSLAQALNSARESQDRLPEILSGNLDLKNKYGVQGHNFIRESFENYPVKEYTIIEKNGLKIGLFGLIGYEAISFSPEANMNFLDTIDKAEEIVGQLKDEEVDLIIFLSHGGTKAKGHSEDEVLASKVKGIDLIISAHTHRELFQPILVGDTRIVSCGKYGKYLGLIDLKYLDNSWELADYQLRLIDENLAEDRSLDHKIEGFKQVIQREYLDYFGLKYDQVIGSLDFNFTPMYDFGKEHREDNLANFIADSYIHTIKSIEGKNYEEIDLSIVPAGEIRDSLVRGDIHVHNIFNLASLGKGLDGFSGYPLISSYLYGEDIKKAIEIDATIGGVLSVAQIYMSGVRYKFNPNRLSFNRAFDMTFKYGEEIDDKKLYRVVTSLYTGQMLGLIDNKSKGIISIVPRDKNGRPIKNLEDHIIYSNGRELKQWYAIAKYVEDLGEIPLHYKYLKSRKLKEDDKSVTAKIEKPNNIAKAFYSGLGLISALSIVILGRVSLRQFKKSRKRSKKNQSDKSEY